MVVFGPIPSRRLGHSLGINHIPPKHCSYSCVYCQVGPTPVPEIERRAFLPVDDVVAEVTARVGQLRERGDGLDFLTFVPDGEPTLDLRLGEIIGRLRPLGVPIAVITNATLLGRADVRAALAGADWVSVKVDAAREAEWRRVNRPHPELRLSEVLDGTLAFARAFTGRLATETMLVGGFNDGEDAIEAVVAHVAALRPETAYVALPTRPTAERGAEPPAEDVVARVYQQFATRLPRVELLAGFEGTGFGTSGDAERDLLSITAVHAMREDTVTALLERDGADWTVVEALIARGELVAVPYRGHHFYMRRFTRPPERGPGPSGWCRRREAP